MLNLFRNLFTPIFIFSILDLVSPLGARADVNDLIQDTRMISPAFKSKPELFNAAEPTRLDTSSEDYRNCAQLGGTPSGYNLGESEALLCRFGVAGIGASSLLNYKNQQTVKSIEAFLNYVAPDHSQPDELAVVPKDLSSTGAIGPFEAKPNPHPDTLQPGIRMILPPKVQISSYCRQRGGKPTQLRNPVDGTPLKACIFDDYSGIDATTLYKGPSDPSNDRLRLVLKSLR